MVEYLREPPKPTEEQLGEILKLRESRSASIRAERESFERSDTDGFLSQWAHSMGAQRDARQIEILENGGHVRVRVLCDEDGTIVAYRTRVFPNRNAPWTSSRVWDLGRDAEQRGWERRWVPVGERSRVQKGLGVHEEFRWVPGYARITAPEGARGLGGCASAFVGHFRSDTNELTY